MSKPIAAGFRAAIWLTSLAIRSPRPLAVACHAVVVDIDDHDRQRLARAWLGDLQQVEQQRAEWFHGDGVAESHGHENSEDDERKRPSAPVKQGREFFQAKSLHGPPRG